MTPNLMSLEALKAQDPDIGPLLTCTEPQISALTRKCLTELTQRLSERPQSRDAVTRATQVVWMSAHMAFFDEHKLETQQMARVYQLSGLWLRQRLFQAQLSGRVPEVHFAHVVTIGEQFRTQPSGLSDGLFELMELTLVQEGYGWDAAVFAASELLADTMTELYGIGHLMPHGQDLWPMTARLIEWDELTSQDGPISYGGV